MPHFIFFTDLMLNYLGGTERGIFLYSVCLKHLLSFIFVLGFFFLFFCFLIFVFSWLLSWLMFFFFDSLDTHM